MIFLRKITILLPLLGCTFLLSCKPKPEENKTVTIDSSSSSIQQLENINGIWVAQKYLDSLTSNRNPFNENPESLEIDIQNKKLIWTNFHEGYERNIFEYGRDQNVNYLKVSEPESSSADAELERFTIENGAIIFSTGKIVDQINERFTRIPSALSNYANKLILSGNYKDSDGKHYEFTESGSAIWPEQKFGYEFVLDSSEADCPYINSSIKDDNGYPKRFGYKWESETLNIFDIVENNEAPISCAKEPFLKLTKN